MSSNMHRDRANPKKKWEPTRYLAECCNSIIFSRYSGHLCSCKCGEAFVDETDAYGRCSGKMRELPKSELEKELE